MFKKIILLIVKILVVTPFSRGCKETQGVQELSREVLLNPRGGQCAPPHPQ